MLYRGGKKYITDLVSHTRILSVITVAHHRCRRTSSSSASCKLVNASLDFLWVHRGEPHLQSFALIGPRV